MQYVELSESIENKCFRHLIEHYLDNEVLFNELLKNLPNIESEWKEQDFKLPYNVTLIEFLNFLSDFLFELEIDYSDRMIKTRNEITNVKLPNVIEPNYYINKLIQDLESKNDSYLANIEYNNKRIEQLKNKLTKDNENDLSSR